MRVSVWDKILKVIIAVASAIAGVIGGQVMAV
ncbi:MAG: smalltalk protein [Bacteroides eggerthii]|nr:MULTISPECIES: smalltalk protein [Bacteroides]MBS6692959.1 smalltalk protein [Bacteroides eggerthii]